MRIGTALIALALLTGCPKKGEVKQGQPIVVSPTQVITKEVVKIVPVPDHLTRDCIDVPKKDNSVAESVRLANARKESTDECTGRMRQIRALGR